MVILEYYVAGAEICQAQAQICLPAKAQMNDRCGVHWKRLMIDTKYKFVYFKLFR